MVSNAVRWEVPLAAEPLSGSARVSLSAGTASTTSTTTPAARAAAGRRLTAASQRAPWVGRESAAISAAGAGRPARRGAPRPGLGPRREAAGAQEGGRAPGPPWGRGREGHPRRAQRGRGHRQHGEGGPVTSLLPDPLDRDEKACPPGCTDSVLLSAALAMLLSASSVPLSRSAA